MICDPHGTLHRGPVDDLWYIAKYLLGARFPTNFQIPVHLDNFCCEDEELWIVKVLLRELLSCQISKCVHTYKYMYINIYVHI